MASSMWYISSNVFIWTLKDTAYLRDAVPPRYGPYHGKS